MSITVDMPAWLAGLLVILTAAIVLSLVCRETTIEITEEHES